MSCEKTVLTLAHFPPRLGYFRSSGVAVKRTLRMGVCPLSPQRVQAHSPHDGQSFWCTDGAPPDLLDDDAVVLVAFAVEDTGLQNPRVQRGEGQLLSDLACLRQDQLHVLESLASSALWHKITPQHLRALGVHDLRIGCRLPRNLEETRGFELHALGKDQPFREGQAVEAENEIDGELSSAGLSDRPHEEMRRKYRTYDVSNPLELRQVAANQGDTATLPNLLTRAGNGRFQQMEPLRFDAPSEGGDPVRIARAGAKDDLARVRADGR